MFFTKNKRSHFQKYGMNMIITMSYSASQRSGLFETMLFQQNTIAKWSNQKYMMYIATRGNVSKAGIVRIFQTIWNCRKKNENN